MKDRLSDREAKKGQDNYADIYLTHLCKIYKSKIRPNFKLKRFVSLIELNSLPASFKIIQNISTTLYYASLTRLMIESIEMLLQLSALFSNRLQFK